MSGYSPREQGVVLLSRARATAVGAVVVAVALVLIVAITSFVTAPAPDVTYAACTATTLPAYTDTQLCYDTTTGTLRAIMPTDAVASAAGAR